MSPTGGRYRIEGPLGRGGMGAVFRAVDLASGNEVALKRMIDPAASRGSRAELRFRREFHTLAALRHPRIVRAFDYGVDEEGPYYTMELLAGEDMKDALKVRERLSPREVCRLLRDVASALATLHARDLIHRDLSPRNVRIVPGETEDAGRAVLFDFGVLVSTGWTGDVAGTPAFVAPEMVRGLPIDGRADLYSLGVLAYVLVTGERPYDARKLRELEALWRGPLVPPSALAPVPEGLEDLILDLLCLEPLGRPPSAAALIDRLTALGELEPDETLAVPPGYVASAALVGREPELETMGKLLERARQGEGRTLYIEAESGAGKSRLLDELALRAKLEGALTLEVSCEKSEGGPYAALGSLIDAAFQAAPGDAAQAAQEDAAQLGRAFGIVRARFGDEGSAIPEPAEERLRTQAAVVRFLRTLAKGRPLVLLVDDVQRSDEASAAAFAGIARADVGGLLLAVARRLGEPVRAEAAVAALERSPDRIRLAGLSREGVEALLRSLFGDVPNLRRLARRIHDASAGSPLHCAELARQLIEGGDVRYADGSWIIPDDVSADDLPRGLADAMARRVSGLTAHARRLGEILAVHGGELHLERIIALAPTTEPRTMVEAAAEVFPTLDELTAQGVLLDLGERFRFRHDSLREALLGGLDSARRRALHRRVGEVRLAAPDLRRAADDAETAEHLYRGGDEIRGAAMLEQAGRALYEAQALADCIGPLEIALEARRRAGATAADRAELAFMLVSAGWVSDREAGARHAEEAVSTTADLGGVSDAHRLARWLGLRLAFVVGLSLATLRWVLRRCRGPSPIRALSLFAVGLTYATALAYAANRKEEVRSLIARAAPFGAFEGHPPYAAYLTLHAMLDILDGRLVSAAERLGAARTIATRRRLNPLSQDEQRLAEAGVLSMRVIVDVNQFEPRLFDDLERLEAIGLEYYRLAAQTARIVRHRYRGEESAARALERETEAVSLQLGSWSTDLQRLLFAHPAYAFCHDVEGLKRCLDALERRVAEGMALEVRVAITRAEILRERGDFEEAHALLEPVWRDLPEDDHLMRQHAGAALAQIALEAYDYERASDYARAVLDAGRDPGVRILLPWLRVERVLGLADDALGRSQDAARRLERAIALAEERDCPVFAGELHEARARVALAAGDRPLFLLHRERAARWLRPTENPGLIAVVERLGELDRETDGLVANPRRRRPGVSSTETSVGSHSGLGTDDDGVEVATVVDRPMSAPDDEGERTVASSPSARSREDLS